MQTRQCSQEERYINVNITQRGYLFLWIVFFTVSTCFSLLSIAFKQNIFPIIYSFSSWKNLYETSFLHYQKWISIGFIFDYFNNSVSIPLVFNSVLNYVSLFFMFFFIIQMFSIVELIFEMTWYTELISLADSYFNTFSLIFRIISSN